MSAAQAVGQDGPLALVCGGGTLPLAVAESVSKRGRAIVLFALRGHADPALVARYPHHWLRVGQLGAFTRLARSAGCREVVFIGSLVRPVLWNLRPDFKALMLLPRIMAAYRGGDNHLLSGVSRIIEDQGFRLLGAHEVAPEILVPEGALGRVEVSEQHRQDIAIGFDYLHASGAFDVGQAVVVAGKRVLAVEAAEGTDQMLTRVAELRATGRVGAPAGIGVLVKAPKPRQDRRFDLPSIGPNTVAGVARAKLAGIAVVGGATVIAEPERLVSEADRAGIFVVGVSAGTER
jgi:UDP-2,3-diacylglucosamine hydrolase